MEKLLLTLYQPFHRQVLPLLTLYQYFTTFVCRDVQRCVDGRILKVRVLTDLGLFSEAFTVLQRLLHGERLPHTGDSSFRQTESRTGNQHFNTSVPISDLNNLKVRRCGSVSFAHSGWCRRRHEGVLMQILCLKLFDLNAFEFVSLMSVFCFMHIPIPNCSRKRKLRTKLLTFYASFEGNLPCSVFPHCLDAYAPPLLPPNNEDFVCETSDLLLLLKNILVTRQALSL